MTGGMTPNERPRQPDHLTVEEAAELARVTPKTLRRWIAKGDLLATKTPGGKYRIHEDNLKDVLGVAR